MKGGGKWKYRHTNKEGVKWTDKRGWKKSATKEQKEEDGSSLATLSPMFPSSEVKTIFYEVITGQEAQPHMAFQFAKAAPFHQSESQVSSQPL